MTQLAAVSRERHAGKRWLRPTSYRFAAAEATALVVGAELAAAALSMPLAFIGQADRHTLVAVLSLTPGRNLFVAPDGRWLGGYVPALFRAYPFGLAPKQGTDEIVLCVDEGSGLVTDAQPGGEPFFDGDGKLSPAVQQTFDLLVQVEGSRRATEVSVAALTDAGVIQPWPIKVKTEQGEQPIGGLHSINEAALNALPDEIFLRLRKASALPLAYTQLLATGQIGILSHLTKLQAQLTPPAAPILPGSLDKLFELPGDDIVRFR
jgi:hypothetical protein